MVFAAAASATALTPVNPVNSITFTIETFAALLLDVSLLSTRYVFPLS